jgi:hypothetical protein
MVISIDINMFVSFSLFQFKNSLYLYLYLHIYIYTCIHVHALIGNEKLNSLFFSLENRKEQLMLSMEERILEISIHIKMFEYTCIYMH